jgi:predicted negative regulator of RcsB-dependent stress response
MMRFALLISFVFGSNFAFGSGYNFDFNNNCIKAYNQLMALQNEAANETLKAELERNPTNLIPHYLADYGDCLQLLFNGDEAAFKHLKNKLDKRIELIDKGDESSPWYLFCKANIQLHWALVHLRFGDNFKAALKFRKSFLLLKENEEIYPNFEENKVLLGLEQALTGAMPENYKWIGEIFGLKGNINKGVSEITSYLNAHPKGNGAMQEEAMIYYAYLKFYLQSAPEIAWRYINGSQFSEDNNLMRSFIKANLALNYRKAETAYSILTKASKTEKFDRYPILQYELAESMLPRLNMECVPIYQQFLEVYKGKHFVKDAWLKISWMAYLQGNTTFANNCLLQIKNNGKSITDADKQALRFAENPVWPLRSLLEVRLLIDGGLYTKALSKIQSIDKKQLGSVSNILEYNFRYGRIFEELKNEEKALVFYTATIKVGRNKKDYFASRAALQKGFIYECQGNKKEAIAQFTDCLSMRNHDAQSSIDQLAKAGLNRLGK